MFKNLTLRGTTGSVVCGTRTAVRFRSWVVHKSEDGKWKLSGATSEVDPFRLTRPSLLFVGEIYKECRTWPVKSISVLPNRSVIAELGPPEH